MKTYTLREFANRLMSLGNAAQRINVPAIMRAAETVAIADVKSRFTTQTAPDGSPWRPLAHPRPSGAGIPLRDKGLLMASISAQTMGSKLRVGSSLEYAGLMDRGGDVRPVKAKQLAIPASMEAARAGGPRRFPRPLVAIRFRSGKGILIEKKSAGKKRKANQKSFNGRVIHYFLVNQVSVPPRPFAGLSAAGQAKITQVVHGMLDMMIKREIG